MPSSIYVAWAADSSETNLCSQGSSVERVGRCPPTWKVPRLHQLAASFHDLHWCWLQDTSDRFRSCFPPAVQNEVMQFPVSDLQVTQLPAKPRNDFHWITIAFACVSTNVLALDHFEHQNEVGRHSGVRTARLDTQMHRLGIASVGIQEARTKPGSYRSEHYSILASGFRTPTSLPGMRGIHQTLP